MAASWTSDETATARRLLASGLALHQVSARIGRTSSAIRAHLEGANGSTWTPERIAKLRELWDGQMSGSQIATELGVSKNAVIGMANRQGMTRRPSPIRPTRTEPAVKSVRVQKVTLAVLPSIPIHATPAVEGASRADTEAAGAKGVVPPLVSAAGLLPTDELSGPAVLFSPPAPVALPREPRARAGRQCMWTDGERGAWRVCESGAEPGKPFCGPHCQRGFTKAAYVAGVGRITA